MKKPLLYLLILFHLSLWLATIIISPSVFMALPLVAFICLLWLYSLRKNNGLGEESMLVLSIVFFPLFSVVVIAIVDQILPLSFTQWLSQSNLLTALMFSAYYFVPSPFGIAYLSFAFLTLVSGKRR